MLKHLSSLIFGKPVEFVALEGQILTVKTPLVLKSEPVKMRMRRNGREVGVRMLPLTARRVPGSVVYSGLMLRRAELAPGMRDPNHDEGFLRRSRRLTWKAKVRGLGFTALTVDISSRGLQLEASQPLEVGAVVNLVLDRGTEDIAFQARVAWCEVVPRGLSRMGLELLCGSLDEVYTRLASARLERTVLSRRIP